MDQTVRAPENVCARLTWCIDCNQLCGPADGYGKCLVEATGGTLCAEILCQARTCTECSPRVHELPL